MRLKLDLDELKFITTWTEQLGGKRWLVVTVKGKQFWVERNMITYRNDPRVDEAIDRLLIEKMEFMLQKFVEDALAAVPDGPINV